VDAHHHGAHRSADRDREREEVSIEYAEASCVDCEHSLFAHRPGGCAGCDDIDEDCPGFAPDD
jgi:hypothetical protein